MKDQSESFKSLNICVIQNQPGQRHIFSSLYFLYYGLYRLRSNFKTRTKKQKVNNNKLPISSFPVLFLSA